MRPSIRRLAVSTAAVALTGVLAACSGTSSNVAPGMDGHGMPSTAGSASPGTARAGDVMFAQMMIPHHQQAVEMSEIALATSDASNEVRQLATEIKQAQDPEIHTMEGWLKAWGESPTPSGMDHGAVGSGMMSDADMAALDQASGTAFDQKWVSMMIDHHEGAIDMARQVLATTEDPEVKTMADAIIEAQTAEISRMRSLS